MLESNWINEYLEKSSFNVFENANRYIGPTGLLTYIAERSLYSLVNEVIPKPLLDLHLKGLIYIHKLPYSLFIPYCCGHSIVRVLKKGIRSVTVYARPAKHLDTYVDHIVNYLITQQHYFSGAQAFSAIELYGGVFVKNDKLTYRDVKQSIQRLIYNLNFPSRTGMQTPFTNFTLILDASKKRLNTEHAIIGGVELDASLNCYLDEAVMIVKALTEVHYEGDRFGRPFTFPILTYMTSSKILYEDSELMESIFKAAAYKGVGYWLNTNIVDPDMSYAMCCRLNIDLKELKPIFKLSKSDIDNLNESILNMYLKSRGIWSLPDVTGSTTVITINIPRLVLESKSDDNKFYELLDRVLEVVRDGLIWFRNRYCRLASKYRDFYSMPLDYVPEVFQLNSSFFNTFGVIGLPEAAAIMGGDSKLWFEGSYNNWMLATDWMSKVVRYIVDKARIWSIEYNTPFNVEEVPGESAAAKLASNDLAYYPELSMYLPDANEPIYSTSIAPYYGPLDLIDRVKIEEKVQGLFTGGVMMHIFLNEEPDPEALAKFTKRLSIHSRLIYWSYTPALSICTRCGWRDIGIVFECPKCGAETEVWSRIIGYYRPLKNWNEARRSEFLNRRHYGYEDIYGWFKEVKSN